MKKLMKRVAFVVLSLAVFASVVEAQEEPTSHKELPNFQKINEQLYRGAQPLEGGLERLVALGVKTIVNLRDDDKRARDEERAAIGLGLRYFNIPLKSYARPDAKEIERILSIIETSENQPVFVHCKRGSDRTGTVIAVYRIRHDNWTAAQALQEANTRGMRWIEFEMKDYIADTYRRQLQANNQPHPEPDNSRLQFAGAAATVTRVALEKSLHYSRRGLKRLRNIVQ